ncbi:MAG: chemotaxis response regulator protein-glutamate methylesterase [Nitrospirota bacterium]
MKSIPPESTQAGRKIRALVVDDSAYNRAIITEMLESDPCIQVVGTAVDGVDAIAKTLRFQPDVITLDLEMSNMDGFTFLRWLMSERPLPVLIISSRSDSRSVFRALELGAVDFLPKPEARISKKIAMIHDDLLDKIHAIMHLEMSVVQSRIALLSQRQPLILPRNEDETRVEAGPVEIVAIASSTGGPPAIQAIVSALPSDLRAGIVVVQHMPAGFTRSFAERLNKLSSLIVSEATDGDRLAPGTVLIAPGGNHLLIEKDERGFHARVVSSTPADRYVPSADKTLASIAQACGRGALGIVLTGMGRDGAEGIRAIKERGGQCLAESRESAVIFGMPEEAIKTGAVDKVLALSSMASEIRVRCNPGSGF